MTSDSQANAADIEKMSQCLDSSVRDVLGTMAGFELMQMALGEAERSSHPAEITGAMLLRGQRDAMLSISTKKITAEVIVAYMTGLLPDEVDLDDLYDGVSELVNLVAGRTKAQLSGHGLHFELSPPLTIVGDGHFIIHKNQVTKISLKYGSGEIELFVELFFIS